MYNENKQIDAALALRSYSITKIQTDESAKTGICYDQDVEPILGSTLVRDQKFQERVVTETRDLLSNIPKSNS